MTTMKTLREKLIDSSQPAPLIPATADGPALGRRVTEWEGFDTFHRPPHVTDVTLTSREFTALCPETGQPDWYEVVVDYQPRNLCLESKSLKLYLQAFRNRGVFCEALAELIANDLYYALSPHQVRVTLHQTPRGGVGITARAVRSVTGDPRYTDA